MFSTVLDCRQSLSKFSFCFFSTWLRCLGLGCIALLEVPRMLIISPSHIGRLLISDGQLAIKLELAWWSAHVYDEKFLGGWGGEGVVDEEQGSSERYLKWGGWGSLRDLSKNILKQRVSKGKSCS